MVLTNDTCRGQQPETFPYVFVIVFKHPSLLAAKKRLWKRRHVHPMDAVVKALKAAGLKVHLEFSSGEGEDIFCYVTAEYVSYTCA